MMDKKPQKGSLEMVDVGKPVSGENLNLALVWNDLASIRHP